MTVTRRLLTVITLSILAFLLTAVPLFACEITVKPEQTSGTVGDVIKVNVTVALTHRNCPVPMSDTQFITSSNLAVIEQTAWVSAGRDVYTTVLSVQLLAAGTGKLEIVRECIKEGGYAAINLTVSGTGVIENPATPVIGLPTDTPDSGAASPVISTNVSDDEMTWAEAFGRVFSQPFIWAYLGLTAFAYTALLLRRRRWRYISLAFSMIYLGFFLGMCPCAIGAIQYVALHLGQPKEYLVHFIILAIPIVSTLFLGRLYCGWVCPMGAVQQFLYRRDLSIKMPEWLGANLKWLRFGVLGAIMAAAFYTGTASFAEVDPFKSLFNAQIAPVPTTLLVIIILSSIFIFTPWCRFLCPMGAVLSVVGRLARRGITFKAECKNCGACAKTFCEYKAISPGASVPVIAQHECARCGECVSRCPKKAMGYEFPQDDSTGTSPVPLRPSPELIPSPVIDS